MDTRAGVCGSAEDQCRVRRDISKATNQSYEELMGSLPTMWMPAGTIIRAKETGC